LAKGQSLSVRAVAARIIRGVAIDGRSLNHELRQQLNNVKEADRSLCQQLCYGVMRQYPALQWLTQQLLNKPIKKKEFEAEALILLGLYQLRAMRTPAHAAISETVNAAKQLNKQWASGLINACLRNYQRKNKDLEATLSSNIVAHTAHPEWLIKRYQLDWGEAFDDIVTANNAQPPMMLRVNPNQNSRDDYLNKVLNGQIEAEALSETNHGILLKQPCDVALLPDFFEGAVSVQDGAAQCVAPLLDLKDNQSILDACAAPGGKTGHILESANALDVTAVDISAERLAQVQENLDRLGFTAKLVVGDAAAPNSWSDGHQFDRILIDAPCSGTGVIRRHPDIKLLRRETDIDELVKLQKSILDKLWPLLKKNGRMVYTTCSALKAENEQQIGDFLTRHQDAHEVRVATPPASERPFGYQRLPGEDGMDGFFYACIERS
jgi:16S rRNA (cytosine967-C5)-methyltransferase